MIIILGTEKLNLYSSSIDLIRPEIFNLCRYRFNFFLNHINHHLNIVNFKRKTQESLIRIIIINFPKDSISETPSKSKMQIYVKTLTAKVVPLEVEPSATFEDLKQMMHDKEGYPLDNQKYIFAGQRLESKKTLEYYGIKDESTVYMVSIVRPESPE